MLVVRSPALQVAVCVFLLLGTLIRPMLVLTCDIHAAAFAHAAQPHVHEHTSADDASVPDSDHGEHASLHQGTLGAAADVNPVVFIALIFGTSKVPSQAHFSFAAHYPSTPFRPPII